MSIYKKITHRGYSDNTNRTHINKELNKAEQENKTPSKYWKKKYPCKRNKGPHEYELTLPPYTWRFGKNIQHLTLNEYYQKEKEHEESKAPTHTFKMFGNGIFCYWQCKHCGKLEFDTTTRPNKKIRHNLTKNIKCPWLLVYENVQTNK